MKNCVTSVFPINPLRMLPDYREYWGDQHARFVEMTDAIQLAGCFVPRVYHAPDFSTEILGALDYLQFIMTIPPGSFILGYLHNTTSQTSPNSPPALSGFSCQITDIARNWKFFDKPVPEVYFLNGPAAPYSDGLSSFALVQRPASPRLLTCPYPVTLPGHFKVEFWNQLQGVTNKLMQLSFLVAVPENAQ
jgi:hypothetical protein